MFRSRLMPGHGSAGSLSGVARTALAVAGLLLLAWPGQTLARGSTPAEAPPLPATWSMNLYRASVVRYQNPDLNGCTAASTVSMLDLVALASQPDQPPPRGGSLAQSSFVWTIDISWNTQEHVMWFERSHMSMTRDVKGSDPSGWRNGLNYYGWGSIYADVYRDVTFGSFNSAAHAVIDSIARTDKPAGVLGWAGSHAQYVTGYTVEGDDPRVSDNYTIVGIYLSDPLKVEARPSVYLTLKDWQSGPYVIKFARYEQYGSIFIDQIDGKTGDSKWPGKWVAILPVR